MDCAEAITCGALLYFPDDTGAAVNFHQWMASRGPDPRTGFQWPADGTGTGIAEIDDGDRRADRD